MDRPVTGQDRAPRAAAHMVVVDADEADRRLDNFLIARLKGVPRAHVYRMIRSGQVRVNSARARPDRRLAAGDRVRIPPVKAAPGSAARAMPPEGAAWIEKRILYEDPALLVLDKPPGLAVHGGSGVNLGAIELLRAARPAARLLSLAHRLDRDTSGCLLVAKTPAGLRHLQAQFREGKVEKVYLALLVGRLASPEVIIDAPLKTTERRGGERHVRPDRAGKRALTRFRTDMRLPGATLARVTLVTGRTHQIRAHAAHIGAPVAGDARYGTEPDPIVARWGLKRLFLHAVSIAFQNPRDGRALRVESPLPPELAEVLRRMRRQ